LSAILAVVHAGDEVIVLDPCYDSYEPNIVLAGAVAVHVPLTAGTFRPDFERISRSMTPSTRAIVINSPHNPSATVWTKAEMEQSARLLRPPT
jgi:methionine aminotransferase